VAERFFPYDFDMRYFMIWRGFGVKPKIDGVTVGPKNLLATYGRFRVETPLSNISCASKTGPYHWWKAVGLRGSAADSGMTFGTTPRGGVCILFKERIPQVVLTASAHEGLTVTVADCDGLVAALAAVKS
jgi:hypothetical protein